MSPTLQIFCDANAKIGFGHIRRAQVLAAECRRQKWDVSVQGLSPDATHALKLAGEVAQSAPVTGDIAVIDSPLATAALIADLKLRFRHVATLDYFGGGPVDLCVNVFQHQEQPTHAPCHHGFEFILLRDEIKQMQRHCKSSKPGQSLVLLGGGDLLGQSAETALRLARWEQKVTLVLGPMAQSSTDVQHPGVTVLRSPANLPELMASSQWGVTNGGGSLFEMMFLGKPVFVLPQTEREKVIADYVFNQGGVLGVGESQLRPPTAEELKMVAARAQALVDGQGSQRIVQLLRELGT